MKKAPITTPPPHRCASMKEGSKPLPPNRPINSVKPISTEKQIWPWMMSMLHSSRPPASSARMELPMTTTGLIAIALAKEISRKQRAASAGLMKFLPSPPKQPLQTTMANTEPITGIYRGVCGPRERASSRPVTTALPSQIVLGFLQILQNSHSVATADTTARATMPKAFQP